MTPHPSARRPPAARSRWAAILGGFALWAVAAPYAARAAGLRLDVPARLEVADHVIPGLLVLACLAAVLVRPAGSLGWLLASGVAFLAGLWITATHVPLIPEALEGVTPWGAALVHLSAGPPVLVAAAWMFLLPADQG